MSFTTFYTIFNAFMVFNGRSTAKFLSSSP